MTKQFEIYKCRVCGNIVEVTNGASGTLSCCEQPMALLDGKTVDGAKEKHLPMIETKLCEHHTKGIVKVGEIPHPMEEKHYITWIEIIAPSKKIIRKNFNPGDEPSLEFCIKEIGSYTIRAYCNLHGLWTTILER